MIEFSKVGSLTDYNTVESLAHRIWNEYYIPIIGKDQVSYMLETYQSFKAIRHQVREGAKYYIINRDGLHVGYLSFEIKEEDAFISKVYVLSEFRGQGIGKACLDFVEKFAKEKNLKAVSLSVNKKNEIAEGFYSKHQFEVIDDVVVDIGGGFVMDDYMMRKSIT